MTESSDKTFFALMLKQQKKHFDDIIENYWAIELPRIERAYGGTSARALQALADIMQRGGKRIRASLAEQAYRMFGGQDEEVIEGMGLAVEMIHAYMLAIDDICDHSDLRRSGPTVHRALEAWHRDAGLHGDAAHFGTSMATIAAMTGLHKSMLIIEALPVSAERRSAAIKNMNHFLVVTCHGQFNDIMNEAASTLDEKRIEDVLLWKTAYYTFANPLQFGALLAGASSEMLDTLMRYSMAAGRAFQISDDILSLYGDAESTGKSPADDIREGKRTLLTVKALELAPENDAAFLESQLGNARVTMQDFERCKTIIRDSGALQFAQKELERSCREASASAHGGGLPDGDGVRFLSGLADYLMDRKA